jgi:hypothetical protein
MTHEKNSAQEISRILAGLGRTPSEVAQVLRANGCRGFRTGSFPSPVIRYVYRRFDEGSLVLVYSAMLLKPDKFYLYTLDDEHKEIPLPDAVAEFLALFDAEAYPELDMETDRPAA